MIVPFYICYFIIFPIIWFFLGYAIYSFQLFPISRISNRWLYAFVYECFFLRFYTSCNSFDSYSYVVEDDKTIRRRFDTSDAIILPMVQKGKVEETILESMPQLVIQLLNTWFLGQIRNIPNLTLFSISLSILSIGNTIWYYAYWNLFKCKPIRDVPSTLSLYNYKLSGVDDGFLCFGKPSHQVADMTHEQVKSALSNLKDQLPLNTLKKATDNADTIEVFISNEISHDSNSCDAIPASATTVTISSVILSQLNQKDAEISRKHHQLEEKNAENMQQRNLLQEMQIEISRLKQELNRSSERRPAMYSESTSVLGSPRFTVRHTPD